MNAAIQPVKNAKLPASYEHARAALEKCEQIDECKEWADKAAALASYAKQAEDETLFKTAMRIKGRAIRRVGELLKQIETRRGSNQNIREGARPKVETRQSVAEAAGLSSHQQKQALRIAELPKREFEKAIEAEKPPTLTALAKQGKRSSSAHLKGRRPEEFSASIDARGRMRDMADMCERIAPAVAVRGAREYDHPKMKAWARTIATWVAKLQNELKRTK
jgi:hypothetical protein